MGICTYNATRSIDKCFNYPLCNFNVANTKIERKEKIEDVQIN